MATQLAQLPEVERLSASVLRILGGNPGKFTLQGTNTYLVGRGPQRLLIDTGEGKPAWAGAIRSVLSNEKATVKQVLLTHWHPDHVSGVQDFLKIYPNAQIFKNQTEPRDEWDDIRDGQVFQVEGATLRALHTPGHTIDHMAFVLEEEDAMFTGDNVLGHGTAVFEDLTTYVASLEKMKDHFSGRAYPGHGAVIEDGRAKIFDYIQHRQQREDEVLRVLKYGRKETDADAGISAAAAVARGDSPAGRKAWTPMDIVKIIYRDVPENLHLPAANGVIQVLLKLEAEGRAAHDGESGKWSATNGRATL